MMEAKKLNIKTDIKRIGVMTSGGDSPGMNACVRAVVRTGMYYNVEVYGIYRGYQGMIEGEIKKLSPKSVANIIQRGGTILKTARSEEFKTPEGRKKAYENLQKNEIDALFLIGGDGTFTGASILSKEFDIPVIGAPGTIDNDLFGTDYTIGYDTAVNTVIEAVDKIRDTAAAHNRLFFIEVMGRDAGFIALRSGIATGAEAILIPESVTDMNALIKKLKDGKRRKKDYEIVIVSEGDDAGGAYEIAKKAAPSLSGYDIKVTVLGHVQRGGSPTAADRVLASTLGVAGVEALLEGRTGEMVGMTNKKVSFTPFEKAIKHHNTISQELLRLAEILSI